GARARSRPWARRWVPPIRRTRRPALSAATWRCQCRTTSCMPPTPPRPPPARSSSGSANVAEPDYVALNRENWTRANAEYTDAAAREGWEREEVLWGQWHQPDSEVGALRDVAGKDLVELGCGTGYFGAVLKRLGARRVVGVDVTPAQLETARRMNEEFGLGLEFLEENAEKTSLPDGSFDLVFSEYGASIWCDPALWIAEAARLLRPDGELVFMRGSTLVILCMPDEGQVGGRLVRPQRG